MTTHLSGIQSEDRVDGRETDMKQHRDSRAASNNQTLKKQLDENSELDVDQELKQGIIVTEEDEMSPLKIASQSKTPDSLGTASNREASSQTKKFTKRQSP